MANKTLQFYGIGFAPSGEPVSITSTYDGETIFTGTIPSLPTLQSTPESSPLEVLFTHEVPGNLTAIVPMSVTVTSGAGFTLGPVMVNSVANPETFVHLPASEGVDCRKNVQINGVPQDKGPLANVFIGQWNWNVLESSTITYDLDILNVGNTTVGNTTP